MRRPPRSGSTSRALVRAALLSLVAVALGLVAGRLWLEEHPVRSGIRGCVDIRRAPARIECLRSRAADAARADGDARAVVQLRRAAARPFPVECHLAMHVLGERAGRRAGRTDFEAAWSDVDLDEHATCDQGWIHGFMSAAFRDLDEDEVGRVLATCARIIRRAGECDHAIGHVFLRDERSRDGASAFTRCDRLDAELGDGRAPAARAHDCQHGAVMEAALLDAREAHPRIDTCSAVDDGAARTSCYEFLTARAILLGDGWKRAARRCERLRGSDRDACRTGWIEAAPSDEVCEEHPDVAQRRACRRVRS